jgi:hypothetical protein
MVRGTTRDRVSGYRLVGISCWRWHLPTTFTRNLKEGSFVATVNRDASRTFKVFFLEIGSLELFAWAGFELLSS